MLAKHNFKKYKEFSNSDFNDLGGETIKNNMSL